MTATWTEALAWMALGALLRHVPWIVSVLCAHREDYLSLHKERRQIWCKDSTL